VEIIMAADECPECTAHYPHKLTEYDNSDNTHTIEYKCRKCGCKYSITEGIIRDVKVTKHGWWMEE
jgi:transposase-like protein